MVYVTATGAFFLENDASGFLAQVFCGFDQYLENFVVIWAGGTRAQGLGEPPGACWGIRWAGKCEGIPY